ncbi:MAG: (Fe-S)-binding protein [Anaerolineae bacterium]|nr:(Fe-S)-binding protein [Anaerolineae bacterium]MCX8066934.1 (Fe-S)-binding protein [Anaerolineae bacterium]MDW7991168.1 (Fe-S)-binding protein [Anaerolineae bacterium]
MRRILDLPTAQPDWIHKVVPEWWEKLSSCMQCGTCSASCPTAYAMDYTPRQLWQMIRLGLVEKVLTSRTFWLCTVCKSCQVRCPRGIPLTDTMVALKEYAFRSGADVPSLLVQLGETVTHRYNISGDDNASRLIWSQNLPRPLEGVNPPRRTAEVVYFVGCVSSFYPRAYAIPQALVEVLAEAEIAFTTLGGDEWCCGYPLYVVGLRERMETIARHNVERVREVGAKRVVFTCPSCYYAWTHLYPEMADVRGLRLQHATELLAEVLEEGRLNLGTVENVVTYHDPCDLGRKGGVYDAPREVLARIPGLQVREMEATRENSLCCGGGGDVEIADASVTMGVATRRLNQALATGAQTIVSACQQCRRTFQEAARQNRLRVRAVDVVELVWLSVQTWKQVTEDTRAAQERERR